MKRIFMTGATGVMGMKGMKEILDFRDYFAGGRECPDDAAIQLTVLARRGKRNEKKLRHFIERGVKVIWGDLLDASKINEGVGNADIVLHVGGMVSPAADYEPEKTYRVNTQSMSLIVEAARKREQRGDTVAVVYIGSVAQYGSRDYPHQWGRVGDPIASATFDKYALSKSVAEIILSESGLKKWVSIRQTSILHPGLLGKADNPVAFHVPMAGALEWVTDDDSGRLLEALCQEDLPDEFWKNYYNVGGGHSYRMSNYDFMKATLGAVGCPGPERVFELNWFATRNFHGMFYTDSDLLDSYLHFRSGESFSEHLKRLRQELPFYYKLAPLVPAMLIKGVMGTVANKKNLGTRRWIKENNESRIKAAFGSRAEYDKIPDWSRFRLPPLWDMEMKLDHGYDENKSLEELTFGELDQAAIFRGGRLVSAIGEEPGPEISAVRAESDSLGKNNPENPMDSAISDPDKPLEWVCGEGHRFRMTPRTVLKGGHWCPECLMAMEGNPEVLGRLVKKNRFLRQIT